MRSTSSHSVSIALAMTPRATSVLPSPTSSATRKRRTGSSPKSRSSTWSTVRALEVLEPLELSLDVGPAVLRHRALLRRIPHGCHRARKAGTRCGQPRRRRRAARRAGARRGRANRRRGRRRAPEARRGPGRRRGRQPGRRCLPGSSVALVQPGDHGVERGVPEQEREVAQDVLLVVEQLAQDLPLPVLGCPDERALDDARPSHRGTVDRHGRSPDDDEGRQFLSVRPVPQQLAVDRKGMALATQEPHRGRRTPQAHRRQAARP